MDQLLKIVGTRATLLLSIVLLVIVTASIAVDVSKQRPVEPELVEKLPFCGPDVDHSDRLLYVSTLDGTLSALDLKKNGELRWALKTNPGTLLSSSIHRLELTNNGKWVRMIPSLNGGLYKFDGETIEQIPVTADHLLSSSFKFSEDLVISGGKETRSYGVSARTGKVLYECSMSGCKNITDLPDINTDMHVSTRSFDSDEQHDPLRDDVIVVRRQTQTVRAVEPRTGGERWNFSVGHHDLEMLKPNDCHRQAGASTTTLDYQLAVNVPEGTVIAYIGNKQIWQHKFDRPIVNAWKLDGNDVLKNVDLFTQSSFDAVFNQPPNLNGVQPASVYVGMFEKQLYIQESEHLKKIINKQLDATVNQNYLKIPWKPYPTSKSAVALIQDDSAASVTALSVLYGSEYVNGNGFFLYSSVEPDHCDNENTTDDTDDTDEDPHYSFPFGEDPTSAKIIIVSLWFWWKEIMVISLTTALILNVVLSRRMASAREVVIIERHVEIQVPVVQDALQTDEIEPRRSLSESLSGGGGGSGGGIGESSSSFVSRYQTDFDMVQCLGKGGFGVVFESKNKLDDCKYAIKRIVLPTRQASRERVMREVKTLAHCEHQNIVRYFQAWVEMPPPGWQENEDRIWMDREAMSHSIDIESPTETSLPPNSGVFSELINKNDKELDSWISNLNTNECLNFDDNNRKTVFRPSFGFAADDDDSFIQFRDDTMDDNSDSVFASKSVVDADESFDIEFKEPIRNVGALSKSGPTDLRRATLQNGLSIRTNSITPNDSFSIDFKDSTNGIVKQRTFSENDETSLSRSLFQKGGWSLIDTTEGGGGESRSHKQDQLEPFKKTHRRPMSLDLTSRRQLELINTNRMYLYIQMQLCMKQSLKDWLRLNNLQSRQDSIVSIFKQIVDGVEYCHLKGLIHRDLKPSNIFFSLDGQIKIGDFGLVTDMSDIPNTPSRDISGLPYMFKHTEQVGTHLYMSPEQLQGRQYNYKVDIYSLGLIFFELLVVFGTEMERIETLKSLRMSVFPEAFSRSFVNEFELLKVMLSQLPHERPTTIGIRSRPPLSHVTATNIEWHFELPPRRRDSHASGHNSSSSGTTIEPSVKSK